MAIVELRCLDVSQSLSTFIRVRTPFFYRATCHRRLMVAFKTYWAEALALRSLACEDATDNESVQTLIGVL